MAKQSGLGDNLYIAGYDLSGDIASLDAISGGPAALDVTSIDKSAMQRIGGLRDGNLDYTAFFDKQTGQAHQLLKTLPTTDEILTYCRGTVLGNPAACINAKQLNYDGTRAADGTFTFKVSAQANGFGIEWGKQATPGKRTDTAATIGPATVDDGASSAFGLQAYVQVFAFAGTDATISLRSASDAGFTTNLQTEATLVVSAAPVTARLVGANSTVQRFIKVNTTTTGGFTNLVFSVVYVRNEVAVAF